MVDNFGQLPLLDHHSLTLRDIAPVFQGEIALVFLDSGERFFVMRGELEDKTKKEWENYGIIIENWKGSTIVSLESIDQELLRNSLRFSLKSIFPASGGSIRMQNFKTTMYFNQRKLSLTIPENNDFKARRPDNLPETTIVWASFSENEPSLSLLLWGLNFDSDTQVLFQRLLTEKTGDITLILDEFGIGYRIRLEKGVESQLLSEILQKAAMFSIPHTTVASLFDGTLVEEMRLEKGRVDMSIQEADDLVQFQAKTSVQTIFAETSEIETIITNRESLLRLPEIQSFQIVESNQCLDTRGAFLNNKLLSDWVMISSDSWNPTLQYINLANFSVIFKNHLTLCW